MRISRRSWWRCCCRKRRETEDAEMTGLGLLGAVALTGRPEGAAGLPLALELGAMGLSGFFGAVVAANRQAPVLGVVIGGLIVSLGGGVVRDLLLNTMPFAIGQWQVLPVVALAC